MMAGGETNVPRAHSDPEMMGELDSLAAGPFGQHTTRMRRSHRTLMKHYRRRWVEVNRKLTKSIEILVTSRITLLRLADMMESTFPLSFLTPPPQGVTNVPRRAMLTCIQILYEELDQLLKQHNKMLEEHARNPIFQAAPYKLWHKLQQLRFWLERQLSIYGLHPDVTRGLPIGPTSTRTEEQTPVIELAMSMIELCIPPGTDLRNLTTRHSSVWHHAMLKLSLPYFMDTLPHTLGRDTASTGSNIRDRFEEIRSTLLDCIRNLDQAQLEAWTTMQMFRLEIESIREYATEHVDPSTQSNFAIAIISLEETKRYLDEAEHLIGYWEAPDLLRHVSSHIELLRDPPMREAPPILECPTNPSSLLQNVDFSVSASPLCLPAASAVAGIVSGSSGSSGGGGGGNITSSSNESPRSIIRPGLVLFDEAFWRIFNSRHFYNDGMFKTDTPQGRNELAATIRRLNLHNVAQQLPQTAELATAHVICTVGDWMAQVVEDLPTIYQTIAVILRSEEVPSPGFFISEMRDKTNLLDDAKREVNKKCDQLNTQFALVCGAVDRGLVPPSAHTHHHHQAGDTSSGGEEYGASSGERGSAATRYDELEEDDEWIRLEEARRFYMNPHGQSPFPEIESPRNSSSSSSSSTSGTFYTQGGGLVSPRGPTFASSSSVSVSASAPPAPHVSTSFASASDRGLKSYEYLTWGSPSVIETEADIDTELERLGIFAELPSEDAEAFTKKVKAVHRKSGHLKAERRTNVLQRFLQEQEQEQEQANVTSGSLPSNAQGGGGGGGGGGGDGKVRHAPQADVAAMSTQTIHHPHLHGSSSSHHHHHHQHQHQQQQQQQQQHRSYERSLPQDPPRNIPLPSNISSIPPPFFPRSTPPHLYLPLYTPPTSSAPLAPWDSHRKLGAPSANMPSHPTSISFGGATSPMDSTTTKTRPSPKMVLEEASPLSPTSTPPTSTQTASVPGGASFPCGSIPPPTTTSSASPIIKGSSIRQIEDEEENKERTKSPQTQIKELKVDEIPAHLLSKMKPKEKSKDSKKELKLVKKLFSKDKREKKEMMRRQRRSSSEFIEAAPSSSTPSALLLASPKTSSKLPSSSTHHAVHRHAHSSGSDPSVDLEESTDGEGVMPTPGSSEAPLWIPFVGGQTSSILPRSPSSSSSNTVMPLTPQHRQTNHTRPIRTSRHSRTLSSELREALESIMEISGDPDEEVFIGKQERELKPYSVPPIRNEYISEVNAPYDSTHTTSQQRIVVPTRTGGSRGPGPLLETPLTKSDSAPLHSHSISHPQPQSRQLHQSQPPQHYGASQRETRPAKQPEVHLEECQNNILAFTPVKGRDSDEGSGSLSPTHHSTPKRATASEHTNPHVPRRYRKTPPKKR
jgi:hypothetical protein